jgi:plastocyanin
MGRIVARVLLTLALCLSYVVTLVPTSHAATFQVSAIDNVFTPKELHIDVGDRVVWKNSGIRVHTVTSDTGLFDSGDLFIGQTFARTFKKEGYYFYHCTHHGSARTGMWGVVVVGDPEPPGTRPKVIVPDDYSTIQKAVNHANPGSTVIVKPGTYRERVVVPTPDLIIKGVDRFRTILRGSDSKANGFVIDGISDVRIRNMTIRNFTQAGISIKNADGYTVAGVDLIKNRTYGVHAVASFDGVIRGSFGWGSGDSAFRIDSCFSCSTIVAKNFASHNFMGIATINTTGLVIDENKLQHNGAGLVSMSLGSVPGTPGKAAYIAHNIVRKNNYSTIPAAGLSESYGLPFGTGIWAAGTQHSEIVANEIRHHDSYGTLVTKSWDDSAPPMDNETRRNLVRDSDLYELAWDGAGENNCFSHNDVIGTTGPPDLQTTYACSEVPFVGTPYDPVASTVAAALADTDRPQSEPPEPDRPDCQAGAPGCSH